MKKLLIRIRNQNLSSKIFSLNYSSGRYFKKGEINNLRCIFFNPLPFLSPPGITCTCWGKLLNYLNTLPSGAKLDENPFLAHPSLLVHGDQLQSFLYLYIIQLYVQGGRTIRNKT